MGCRLNLVIRLFVLIALVLSLGGTTAMAQPQHPNGPSAQDPGGPPEILADRDGNRLFDNLEKRMAKAAEKEALPVIVLFDRPVAQVDLPAVARQVGGFAVTHQWEVVDGIATDLNKGQITALSHLPFVKQVELDVPVYATLDTATYWTGVQEARTKLSVTGDLDGAATYSKNDVVIAVLDTGIDPSHQDLAGKVIAWKDYINTSTTTAYDDHGHGTHCASIATGTGAASGGTFAGVAPGAALVGVKVLNSSGSGSDSGIIAAINWVVANKDTYGIRIMSMSIGTTAASDGTDALSMAVNNAVDAGIISVIAAGNSGAWKSSIGSPGAAAKAITAGAMADVGAGGYHLAAFSSRGPVGASGQKPDLAAPGVAITAAKANSTNQYVAMSGTSMATPFTAGVVALMLDRNPSLTATLVKEKLQQTAKDFELSGFDYESGYGRLDALAAVDAAGTTPGSGLVPPPTPASAHVEAGGFTSGERLYPVYRTETGVPLAVALTIPAVTCGFVYPGWPGCLLQTNYDYDLELRDATGRTLATATSNDRQDTISVSDPGTGTYWLRVYVCSTCTGGTSYYLDVSGATGTSPTENRAPTAAADSYAVNEDGSLTVASPGVLGNDSDPDGDSLTAARTAGPSHGTLNLNANGSFTYTPNANWNGTDTFTYTASDGKGGADTATVTVTVNPVNDPPVAGNDSATTTTDTAVTIAVLSNDSDVDGDTLSVASVGGATNGTLAVATGATAVTYTPNAGFVGPDSFTYVVSDGHGGSASANVSVTVNSPVGPTVHVGDLDGSRSISKRNWTASVTIRVDNATHGPVSNVSVRGTWTGGSEVSCTTKSAGTCTVKITLPSGTTSVTFSVTNLVRSGYTYDPAANHNPDGDGNATPSSITVSRP